MRTANRSYAQSLLDRVHSRHVARPYRPAGPGRRVAGQSIELCACGGHRFGDRGHHHRIPGARATMQSPTSVKSPWSPAESMRHCPPGSIIPAGSPRASSLWRRKPTRSGDAIRNCPTNWSRGRLHGSRTDPTARPIPHWITRLHGSGRGPGRTQSNLEPHPVRNRPRSRWVGLLCLRTERISSVRRVVAAHVLGPETFQIPWRPRR